MLTLTEQELQIVKNILQQYVPEYPVWAFGSRVKNSAKPYSDLDLAIITDRPLSLAVRADLTAAFSESDLPWKVDIVDWAITDERFREIIREKYEIVQRPN